MEFRDEQQLIERLREGDLLAFDQVYSLYRSRLYGFLVRMSGSREIAEDLLQETWLRLAQRTSSLRKDTHLASWLFTVARNLFYSYCRNRLLDANRIQELGRLHIVRSDRPSPLEAVAGGELAQMLERLLACMQADFREALLLVGVEGMTPCEAAGVCGLKPDAFRKRLSRARDLLAKKLEERGAPPYCLTGRRHHD